MDTLKIAGSNQPDMPWEDRPAGSKEVMWRYSANPIIGRHALSTSNSIFNSAVIPFKKGKYNYAGVFRCDDTNRRMRIHVGFSVDGLRWEIEESDFRLEGADAEIGQWVYGYDPRVAKIGDKYYVTWCNGYHGPTIGIAWTDDFETFHQLENAFLPYNRNGVLFPRKIGGRFAMLSRPSDTGHTPFGDIFYSESPDMEFWGRHRHVMSPSAFEVSAWQCMKIGAGPVPIETSEGWLLFYHGVLRSCNGYVYAFGSALLDLEEPWKVIGPQRSLPDLPARNVRMHGRRSERDVPLRVRCTTPRRDAMAVYYGCADTVTGLAFGYIPEIIDFTKQNYDPLMRLRRTLLTLALAAAVFGATAAAQTPADWVDPFIGTTNFGTANPGAVTPHGMMSVVPFNVMGSEENVYDKDARWWSTPYEYHNKFFTGFAHGALSGVGCPELGALLTMATTGPLTVDYREYGTSYRDEKASPGYYSVFLDKYGVLAEATATARSSAETLHLPGGARAYPVKSGRGAYERERRDGSPGERHGDRGYEVAGDVLLQCAEGFPGVLRAARFEDSECRRLLEEAAEDDGRGGRVDAGQREV